MKKINLEKIHTSKVWEWLYPIYAKQFLFGNSYEELAQEIQKSFVLTPNQWEAILGEWEYKEMILSTN